MIDFELAQLRQNPEWQLVLSAYYAEHLQAKATTEEFDGWLDRVTIVEGVKDEHLPRIHGKLIALSFLKFDLTTRTSGVRYQMSQSGLRAVNRTLDDADDDPAELAQSA